MITRPIPKFTTVATLVVLSVIVMVFCLTTVVDAQYTVTPPAIATAQDLAISEAIEAMRISQLRKFLSDREADCDGCVEKAHLVERAMQVRGWSTIDDKIADQLALYSASARTHLSLHHITTPTPDQTRAIAAALDQSMHRECRPPLANGTVFCVVHAPAAAAM